MKSSKLTGAQIVVRELIYQGVDTVFGYPGGQVLELYDALYAKRRQIKHILTAHEQGAAHAADGYARASGKTGVVIATSGPGASNLVTGIATAYLDSVPMVAITGNVELGQIGRDSFQELDITDITMPITKHNYIVKDISRLQPILREAFEIAREGRCGPVLVDIPKDIQRAKFEWNEIMPEDREHKLIPARNTAFYSPTELETELERAARIINSAERPLIYCGGGAVSAGSGVLALELAEILDAPIGCSLMGLSAIPSSSPRRLGLTGMHGLSRAAHAVSRADVIIAVGARFTDRATGAHGELVGKAKIVQLDIDPAEIDKNVTDAAYLVGQLNPLLSSLIGRAERRTHPEWTAELARVADFDESVGADNPTDTSAASSYPLTPFAIIDAVSEHFPKITTVTDVGQHQMWAAQRCKPERERSFITSGGLGTMGFGMGAAIGASLATQGEALLYTGDGSFGMNLTELATAVSYQIPLLIVLMNNRSLGMVKQWQKRFYKRTSASELDRATDFVKVAEAFGARTARARSPEELTAALESAKKSLAKHIPFLIECVISPDEVVSRPNPS